MKNYSAILILFLFIGSSAHAFTPKEVKDAYDFCVKFVKMTPAEQKQNTREGGSAKQLLWACKIKVRNGLKKEFAGEKEYQEWLHRRSGSRAGNSLDCLANEHFVMGRCEPKSLVRCDNGGQCAFGEGCTDGVCH